MSTIIELFEECIENDYSFMAHALYYVLREKIVSPEEPHTALDDKQIDWELVNQWTTENYLCLNTVKVFSLKIADNEFAFVFAHHQQEAREFLHDSCKIKPINCHEYLLDCSMLRGNEYVTFREMKKDFLTYPALIGFYHRDEVYQ
jgi:hypothetical protein